MNADRIVKRPYCATTIQYIPRSPRATPQLNAEYVGWVEFLFANDNKCPNVATDVQSPSPRSPSQEVAWPPSHHPPRPVPEAPAFTRWEPHLQPSRVNAWASARRGAWWLGETYRILVERAEDWPFGSLWRWSRRPEPLPKLLTPWPIRRMANWIERVNQPLGEKELRALRGCVQWGRPFGAAACVEEVARRTGLDHTLGPRLRPRKLPAG